MITCLFGAQIAAILVCVFFNFRLVLKIFGLLGAVLVSGVLSGVMLWICFSVHSTILRASPRMIGPYAIFTLFFIAINGWGSIQFAKDPNHQSKAKS